MVWRNLATSTSTSWLRRRGAAPRRRLRGPERRPGPTPTPTPTRATTQARSGSAGTAPVPALPATAPHQQRGYGRWPHRPRCADSSAGGAGAARQAVLAPRSCQCGRGRGTHRPRCSAQAARPAPAPRASLWLVRAIRFETQLQMGLPRIRRGRPGPRWTGPEQ